MPYESDARFVSRTIGHAVLASLGLTGLFLWWFTTKVENGTPEETYLLVMIVFLVSIFIACFAAHLVIQFRLEESDRQKIEFLLGRTISNAGEYADDKARDAEEHATEN